MIEAGTAGSLTEAIRLLKQEVMQAISKHLPSSGSKGPRPARSAAEAFRGHG